MFELLLGHLAGDYLLQNEWMALNKSKNTRKGWLAAFVHCVLYTLAVCLFMQNLQPIWIGVVFLTHFPIDKFMLAEKYLHFIKGKGLKDYVKKDNPPPIGRFVTKVDMDARASLNRYDALEGGFTALVYSVTDNAMHLILMWGAYQIIY
jgi:hypothetical protein